MEVSVRRILSFTLTLILVQTGVGFSQGLLEGLNSVLEEHPNLASAQADHAATRERRDGKFKDNWLPNMDLGYDYGYQHYDPADGDSSDETPQEFSLRVAQLLTDFGESRSEIAADSFSVKQKEANVEVIQQQLLMQGLDAYIQVQRANRLIGYSNQSVLNIRKQTKMENILVEKGKGYSSNVLQAKTQLAGALTRQNQANADLDIAVAGVYAIYQNASDYLTFKEELIIPEGLLPESVDQATAIAFEKNPTIDVGDFRSKTFEEKIYYERVKNFAPDLFLVGEINRDYNLDGNIGTKHDDRVMLELNFPLNLGLSGLNHTAAARKDLLSSQHAEQSTRRDIERSVYVAWRNHRTSMENIGLLINKVNLAEEFLGLARKERKIGRRSLLDVLAAETTLINSQSELATAEADVLRSAYALLYSMGSLNMDIIAATIAPAKEEEIALQPEPKSPAIVEEQPQKEAAAEILLSLVLNNKPYSTSLTTPSSEELKKVSDTILAHPESRIEILGYVGSNSNNPANIELSEQRADTVKEQLLEYGAKSENLTVKGMGNQNPVASNDTREGRRQNRRVEVIVYGAGD